MQRKYYFTILSCVVFCLFITLNSYGKDVLIATDEYPPYATEYAENLGFVSEIVSAVLKKMGMNSVYEFCPWKRGQANVKSGKTWATFPYVKTAERIQDYWFTAQPLFVAKDSFFYCKSYLSSGIQWDTLEDLKPYKIGGVRGYWYKNMFKKIGMDVEYTETPEQSLRKLMAGRIQLFPVTEMVAWSLINKKFSEHKDRFDVLEKPIKIGPAYLMISKTYPDSKSLLKQFDEKFRELEASGEYRRIIEKNGVVYFDGHTEMEKRAKEKENARKNKEKQL